MKQKRKVTRQRTLKHKKQKGGDLQKSSFVYKLLKPITTEKYEGERHFFRHNYTGPGTRLDLRLDENDKPKPGEEPINRVDAACLKHDIAYRDESIIERQKADVQLIHDLNNIPNPTPEEKRQRRIIIIAMKGKILIGRGGKK